MQVLIENGYITSYAVVGGIVNGIEVNAPSDMEHFETYYQAYKLEENGLVYDDSKWLEIDNEMLKQELREKRKRECFSLIDRSIFWYERLTENQTEELRKWYEAWLNVTDTLKIPEKPLWLLGES